jgi:hypothetical protein
MAIHASLLHMQTKGMASSTTVGTTTQATEKHSRLPIGSLFRSASWLRNQPRKHRSNDGGLIQQNIPYHGILGIAMYFSTAVHNRMTLVFRMLEA